MGQNFWTRGYFVSTAGIDEETTRANIKAQEEEDCWLDQINLFEGQTPPVGGANFDPLCAVHGFFKPSALLEVI